MQRFDEDVIVSLIAKGSRVLDLGCGRGELLDKLIQKGVSEVSGVEINERCIAFCVRKGLTVFHGDIDEGLYDYEDESFDYVVLNQTLQVIHKPTLVIDEMLRVGRKAIISFPNFGYYKIRWHLLAKGQIPKIGILTRGWYDTTNIHLLTVSDFLEFCRIQNMIVEQLVGLKSCATGGTVKHFPNLLAQVGIFTITKKKSSS